MFVITIDGYAGCGKSTIAQGLADRLNVKKFNTGAVYRGITCEYLKKYNKKTPTQEIINEFLENLKVQVKFIKGTQNVIVNDTNYTPKLREEIVSITTPAISSFDNLRERVREIQRRFANDNNCIVEGRDIGRVVLPNAQCKFFFVASSEVRAKRRFEQMMGNKDNLLFEEIKKDIEKRDEIDRTREFGTMAPADDAIIVDNSFDTIEQTLDKCEKFVIEKGFKK